MHSMHTLFLYPVADRSRLLPPDCTQLFLRHPSLVGLIRFARYTNDALCSYQLPVYPQGAGGGWPGCGQVISVLPVRVRREHQHVRAGPGPGSGRGAQVRMSAVITNL